MPLPIDPPGTPDDIPRWIIRHATAVDDGEALLDGLGRALNDAGMPLWRLSVGTPSIDPAHRGITVAWCRGVGTSVAATAHGAEGSAEFGRSPLRAMLDEGRDLGRWNIAAGEDRDRFPLFDELRAAGGTDYLLHMVGFTPGTALLGAGIAYVSDAPGGFSEGDLRRIADHVPALGLAVFRISLSWTMRSLLGNYVGSRTAGRVLSGQVRRGQGELMAAAILLVDLKGFTAATDHGDPLRVVGCLDQHLEALGQDVSRDGGEILKFTGDGFVAVFPVFDRDAAPCTVCARALEPARAALAGHPAGA